MDQNPLTQSEPSVSVVTLPPRDRNLLDAFTRPLDLDATTGEILVVDDGSIVETASRAQGDVILFLDADVFAPRGLASAHARRQASRRRQVVLGYTPFRVLHERAPGDFAARLRSTHYEAECRSYDRDPRRILTALWAGNFSLRRDDWPSLDLDAPRTQRQIGLRCHDAGFTGVFDRSLHALRIYEPSLPEFIRDARTHGALNTPRTAEARRGLDPFPTLQSLALRALVMSAGAAHFWRIQDIAASLLWQLELRHGASQGLPDP